MRMGGAPPAAQSEAAQPPADVAAGAHSQAAEGTHIVHDTFLQLARSLVYRSRMRLAQAADRSRGSQRPFSRSSFWRGLRTSTTKQACLSDACGTAAWQPDCGVRASGICACAGVLAMCMHGEENSSPLEKDQFNVETRQRRAPLRGALCKKGVTKSRGLCSFRLNFLRGAAAPHPAKNLCLQVRPTP